MQTLGFLGPVGTHSESAALFFQTAEAGEGRQWQLKPYGTIYEAIRAVAQQEIERCIVPVENSIEGSINITLDTLAHEFDLQVEKEVDWPVHNHLMVKEGTVQIKKIISHAQPISQCREFIKSNYPQAEIQQASSTARAAEIVAGGCADSAVICCARAGRIYGLKTVAEEIQDNRTNCTRFLVLKTPDKELVCGTAKTSLICQINGAKAGSLCDVLQEFASRGVNLTRIESRPARTGLGEYLFFFCMDSSCDKQNMQEAMAAVQKRSLWLKNLGSFNILYGKNY